ncbi:hypothetical protein ACCO45_002016 [Purpureocillium lilacinum]|uniref:Uncharacterized protein n=1 Tax=Purpureocillium lilacinum TaxID=33203 RepID=A0ACC4E9Z6_PURLI
MVEEASQAPLGHPTIYRGSARPVPTGGVVAQFTLYSSCTLQLSPAGSYYPTPAKAKSRMLIAYPRYSKTVRCAIKPPIFSKSDTHGSGFLSCESERILCCTDRSTTRAPGQPATLFDSPAAALALALPRPTSPHAGQTATARTEHEPSGCVQHIARHKAPPTKHLVTGTEALGTSQIWPGPPPPSSHANRHHRRARIGACTL